MGSHVSAETITDEQIRELAGHLEAERNSNEAAYLLKFRARATVATFGGRFTTGTDQRELDALIRARDDANANYHAALRALGTHISWTGSRNTSATERSEARIACAAAWNAIHADAAESDRG